MVGSAGVEGNTRYITLTLEPANGDKGAFEPGQFSMLWVFGVGELPISISGDPEDTQRLVYTVRSVGRATDALVRRKPGDAVGVRSPFGTAWPLQEARAKMWWWWLEELGWLHCGA